MAVKISLKVSTAAFSASRLTSNSAYTFALHSLAILIQLFNRPPDMLDLLKNVSQMHIFYNYTYSLTNRTH